MSRPVFLVRHDYTGLNNLAIYTFDFKIEALAQLQVVVYDDQGVEKYNVRGTDTSVFISSVDFDGVAGGGTVHLLANLKLNWKLVILLANDAPTQASQYQNKFDFTLKKFELTFDFITGPIQRLAYLAKRSIKLRDYDDPAVVSPILPEPESHKFLRWNLLANGFENASVLGGPGSGSGLNTIGSSTDTAVALWDGNNGDALKNSSILERDLLGFVESAAAIGNNQSGASLVGMQYTGLKAAHIHYVIKRIATSTVMETGTLMILFDGTTYTLQRIAYYSNGGIDFSIDGVTGQVLYTTDNMSGVYDSVNSKAWWKYIKLLGA